MKQFVFVLFLMFTTTVVAKETHGITKYYQTAAGEFMTCQTWGRYAAVTETVSRDKGLYADTEFPACEYASRGGSVTTILITPTGRIIGIGDREEVGFLGFGFIKTVLTTHNKKTYIVGGIGGTAVWEYRDDTLVRVFETNAYARNLTGDIFGLIPYGGDDVFVGLLLWTSQGWAIAPHPQACVPIWDEKCPEAPNGAKKIHPVDDHTIAIIHYTRGEGKRPQVTYFNTGTFQFEEVSREL